MQVLRLAIERFRGFESLEVLPRGHVLLVGEPRAGRSDLLLAMKYALDADAARGVSELDFHNLETANDVVIQVTLGELGSELEQRFLDQLEFWSIQDRELVLDAEDPSELSNEVIPAIRIECRLRWDPVEERPTAVVYWVKFSDPSSDEFRRVSREDRVALPFVVLGAGRPLNLAPRGGLRTLIDGHSPGELTTAIDEMVEGVETLAEDLATSDAVATQLAEVLEPILAYLGVSVDEPDEILRFLPEGGTVSGLLRSLAPALALDDAGFLPLARHGSTTEAQVAAAEAVVTAGSRSAVVAVDDFGDSLDGPSAQHLAALLRDRCGQIWLSTRRSEAALRFESEEIVRLARHSTGSAPHRTVHYGRQPRNRGERVAARELDRQVLPAMTAQGLIIGEGVHDRAAFDAIAERLGAEHDVDTPEAFGLRFIDAGGGDGGIDKVPRVSQLARELGFRVVALVDYDHDEAEAASRLSAAVQSAHAVVRLPKGVAIERALLMGLPDEDIVSALATLNSEYSLPLPGGWQDLEGDELQSAGVRALKSNNGLHAQFVDALPGILPPLATRALEAAVECARGLRTDAHVQL